MGDLLHDQDVTDLEVAQAVAYAQHAKASGGRPSVPEVEHEGQEAEAARPRPACVPAVGDDGEGALNEDNEAYIKRKINECLMATKKMPSFEKVYRIVGREKKLSCSRLTLLKLLRTAGYKLGRRNELVAIPQPNAPHLGSDDQSLDASI